LFAISSAILLITGCSAPWRQQLAFRWGNSPPDRWIEVQRDPPPPDRDWRKALEVVDCPVTYVTPEREDDAERLLKGSIRYVTLTPQESADFTGDRSIRVGQPFLLRGIHSFPGYTSVQVHQQRDGNVWVEARAAGLLDQGTVPHAVIAWLERQPGEVYVTFKRAPL
jgi:hypothetical protein